MFIDLISYLVIWQLMFRLSADKELPHKINCNSNGGTWFRNVKYFTVKTMTNNFSVSIKTSYWRLWPGNKFAKLIRHVEITREAWGSELVANEDAAKALSKPFTETFKVFWFILY